MYEDWFCQQINAKKQVAKLLGGRCTTLPERVSARIGWPLSKHAFCLRLREGLLLWFEVWCDNEAVIESKRLEAEALVRRGFRAAFLPTAFSTRSIGMRRPLLVAPLDSRVDFDRIALRLSAAGFEGVENPESSEAI